MRAHVISEMTGSVESLSALLTVMLELASVQLHVLAQIAPGAVELPTLTARKLRHTFCCLSTRKFLLYLSNTNEQNMPRCKG